MTTSFMFTATLTSPLHHGAGTAGNTSLLRTAPVPQPGGTMVQVPFVSGNSLRHQLRDALAWHAAETLGVEKGSLSKPVVDLLWSGGALTKTGSVQNTEVIRRVDEVYPALTLLGYSAGADMVAGTVMVDNLNVVCRENMFRLPNRLVSTAEAGMRVAVMRGEEFGTRHDVAGTAVDRLIDPGEVLPATTQMIYDVQVLNAGTVLCGAVTLRRSATPEHRKVLLAALDLIMPARDGYRELRLGAKTAVGYGTATALIDLDSTEVAEAVEWWTGHLSARRDEILGLWRELVA